MTPLHRMAQCHVMVLSDQREDDGCQVRFKGKPREQSLMKWGVLRKHYIQSDLNPSRFSPLFRVIQAREHISPGDAFYPWILNGIDQPQAIKSA